ncbi:MAG: hypothetical protein AAGJ83_05420 [Planctomycetota bacterium]
MVRSSNAATYQIGFPLRHQFYLRQLLLMTVGSALLFAVLRWLQWEGIQTCGFAFVVFAPIGCYSAAGILMSKHRSWRVWLRQVFLVITFAAAQVFAHERYGGGAFGPLVAVLVLLWSPQLILLKFCSVCRGRFEAAGV